MSDDDLPSSYFDPLVRLSAVRILVEIRAKENQRLPNAHAEGCLRFNPGILERVREEAPALLRHDLLRKMHIRLPEQRMVTKADWELDCDISAIRYDIVPDLAWFWEAIPLIAIGTLDQLLSGSPLDIPIHTSPGWLLRAATTC